MVPMQILQLTPEVRINDAQFEIDQLMTELHELVSRSEVSGRNAIDVALPTAAKLQAVTANVDACNPSRRPGIDRELVALADLRMRSMRDAIERSLFYTAESTMRRLLDQA
jgi:chorismate mutase